MSTAVIEFEARPARRGTARSAQQRRQAPTSVRLTRRGRLVVLVAAIAIAFGGFTLMSDPAVSTSEQHHATNEQVIVEPGQSLWDIATTIAPSEDPRDVIAEIVDLNALESSGAIQAGQALYVPSY